MKKQKPRHGRLNGIGGSVKRRGVAFIVNRICVPEFAFIVKKQSVHSYPLGVPSVWDIQPG